MLLGLLPQMLTNVYNVGLATVIHLRSLGSGAVLSPHAESMTAMKRIAMRRIGTS
jgi:hypothetical protein